MESNFDYELLPIRVKTDDEEAVWFAGVDVCNILEYADTTQAIEKLDEDEKKLDRVKDSSGQNRRTWMINEFGLYSLILTSTKPEAKAFKRWVTHEVLPSLRKAGKYTTEEEKKHEADLQLISSAINKKSALIANLAFQLRELKAEKRKLEVELHRQITRDKSQLEIPFN